MNKLLITVTERTLTLLLDLPDLLHRLFEDGAFVRLDVEVVHVVDVGEDQLGQLLDVLVLLLPVPPLSAPFRAAGKQRHRQHSRRKMGEARKESAGIPSTM